MKTARLMLLSALLLTTAASASAATRGWGVGAGVFDGDFAAQVRKDFWLGGDISQITGQAGIFFPGETSFRLDADYHFMIQTSEGSTSRFYPLGGVSFAFNSDHAKFGLNLGGGVNFMLTETTAGFAELKYILSDWDGFAITAGIYF
jgi:opacity protein-like surface antigen